MADDHTTVLVTADTAKSGASNLCVRYFTSVTPKDEGSVVFGHAEGESVTGTQLRALLENKGIPLENHHPQAYVDAIGGYCNLDDDLVLQLTGEGQGPMRVDVRFTPLAGPMGEMGEEPSTAPKPAAAPVLANPGPMALFAFAMTTCMLMLIETGAVESLSINLVIGFAMFHGGTLTPASRPTTSPLPCLPLCKYPAPSMRALHGIGLMPMASSRSRGGGGVGQHALRCARRMRC